MNSVDKVRKAEKQLFEIAGPLKRELVARLDEVVSRALFGNLADPPALDCREAVGITLSKAAPLAADAWAEILRPHGIDVRLTGAFSFGSPRVTFRSVDALMQCALADLLLVTDVTRGHQRHRRALLTRTRLATANQNDSGLAEATLDETWPRFRFVSRASGRDDRDFRACSGRGGRESSALSLIDLSGKTPPWTVTPRAGPARMSLGGALVELAAGRLGRSVEQVMGDDWSRTVSDLFTRTVEASSLGLHAIGPFRAVLTHAGSHGRGVVVFENTTSAILESALAKLGPDSQQQNEGPISLLHLKLEARKQLTAG